MIVTTYSNGDLLVPARAEGDDAVGDGLQRIGPDHPDYMTWQTAIDDEMVTARPAPDDVRVEEHGELGPVLVEAQHEFMDEKGADSREAGD